MAIARGEIGKHPYLWGSKVYSANGSLDCSGFSNWVFQCVGYEIGPGTWLQRRFCQQRGQRVEAPYQAGDLLFWMDTDPTTPSHVGIATGEDSVIEETASFAANVVESPVMPRWAASYIEGWRVLAGA